MPWPAGVVEFPVFVAFAGVPAAFVPAAHGDDHIGGFDCFVGEDLGGVVGDVDAFFCNGRDCDRVDLVAGLGSCGEDVDAVSGEVLEVAGGHLELACVVDADEEDGGLAHGVSVVREFVGDPNALPPPRVDQSQPLVATRVHSVSPEVATSPHCAAVTCRYSGRGSSSAENRTDTRMRILSRPTASRTCS